MRNTHSDHYSESSLKRDKGRNKKTSQQAATINEVRTDGALDQGDGSRGKSLGADSV